MSWDLFQEFMQDYAKDNGLLDHIVFNASVIKAVRNDADTKWRLEMEREGKPESREFDKVVFCHGYQTKAKMPVFEGAEKFEGSIIHAQQYRRCVSEGQGMVE
jgi:dimethylaniline monooxygenase (N-oxide forming)